jgi:dihydroorotate dehydrogenase (NAD+) catalytic subunit
MDLSVHMSGLDFKNPVILASGPLSASKAGLLKAEKDGFGGVVTKSVTRIPNEGNLKPRWSFSPWYLISADGLPNRGYKAMAEDILKSKEEGITIPVIASIAGTSPEEFVEMAGELAEKGADAVELNLVCPHRGSLVGRSKDETIGRYWSRTPERGYQVVKAVKDAVRIPVWAKFPSLPVLDNMEIVKKMAEAGIDAVVPTPGAFAAMAINLDSGKPILGNVEHSGSLTGHAIKPVGIKFVSEISRVLPTPVVGTGGVYSGLDIIEYVMVGASALEIMTAILQKIKVRDLISQMERFMSEKGYESLGDFRGKSLKFLPPR